MTPRAPRTRRAPAPAEAPALRREAGLAALGLTEGARVRFRRRDGERWKDGTVVRRENDGSLGVRDAKGALRALPLELVEVRGTGPRGGVVWEPLPELAARTEQMGLF
jgi:hypothetical protein